MSSRLRHPLCLTAVSLCVALATASVGAQSGSLDEAGKLYERSVGLFDEGRIEQAIPLAQRALAIFEQSLGSHPDTATLLNHLAELYRVNGEYQKALPLYERALSIREKTAGPNHPDTATALNNLAVLYHLAGAYAKAEPLYQRTLAILEKSAGPDHPDTATALINLAVVYRETAAYGKAEALCVRALAITEKAFGPDDPNTAAALHSLATVYDMSRAYAKAEPLYRRALAIREKTLGPDDPATAGTLDSLAGLYEATAEYSKSEPLYQRALAITERVFGPEHPNTGRVMNNLAELYRTTAAYSKAEPLYQRALVIAERGLGPNHPNTGTALENLAELYERMGAYAKAEPLFQRALAISESSLGSGHPQTGTALVNLAKLYQEMGAYAKAEPLYTRALAIFEKAADPDPLSVASVLNDFGRLYDLTGAYAKAESFLQRALTIQEEALGPGHTEVAGTLANLALLYQSVGAYAKAEPLHARALSISEKALGAEHPGTGAAVHNLASLYHATGAYEKAEALYQRALAISAKALGDAHPQTATAMANLAVLYTDTGAYGKAAPLYERAVAIREKALGANHPDTAMALTNLGGLYQFSGAFEQAEAMHQRALAIREKTLGPEHPETAATLINLALVYHHTRAYTKAESFNQRALTIFDKSFGPDHPETVGALVNLATVYQAMGAYAKSEPLMERAQHIEENNTVRFLLSGSEARKRAYLNMRLGSVYQTVSLSVSSPTAPTTALGLLNVLQFKGRVLDVMSDSVMRLRRSVAPEDRSLLDQLSGVAQQLSLLAYGGPGDASQYRARLNALTQEEERLQTQLSTRSAVFRQAVVPITLESVRQAIPEDTVLLEWFRYEPFDPTSAAWGAPHYMAYVLARGGTPVAVDLGLAQPIETLIGELRDALRDPTTATFRDLAEDLSAKIFKPLQGHIASSTRLLLSPDAALNLVPFAALVDDKGEYLAQRFELTYLTSGRDLLRMSSISATRGSAVVLANPAYDQRTDKNSITNSTVESSLLPTRSADFDASKLVFASLAGTAAEADALRSLLKLDARSVLTGARATEASVRDLRGPRILHLATHGFFLTDRKRAAPRTELQAQVHRVDENPLLRSGLALAGANNRQSAATDDGILTAAEAAQLDLLGTQLVVLSACETGLGELQTGEGVYGLRRALVLAGAQSQLASLWKVSDVATKELMVDYYERLLKGEGRAGALRAAQQAMMENPTRRHPYYWAAFIPIGDWSPLRD